MLQYTAYLCDVVLVHIYARYSVVFLAARFVGKCLVAALLMIAAAFLIDFIGLAWIFTRHFPY
jgi:hypothetical protein